VSERGLSHKSSDSPGQTDLSIQTRARHRSRGDLPRRGPVDDLPDWLQGLAEEIPLAIGADFDNVRVQSTSGLLHLVGAAGCSVIEIRKRAFTPLEVGSLKRMIESGGHDELARSLVSPGYPSPGW